MGKKSRPGPPAGVRAWRRIADRVVPDDSLSGLGHVDWRVYEPDLNDAVTVVAHAFMVSRHLMESSYQWKFGRTTWKRWPSADEVLLGMLKAMAA